MTSRQTAALPEPPEDLARFPTLQVDGVWFRAHRVGRGAWWFAHDLQGRFDLAPPDGTCYLGSDVEVAVRERLGETLVQAGMIAAPEAERMVVSRLRVSAEVADTTTRDASDFGVTRELATITPYALTQRWAAALSTAGYDGLTYWPRFALGSLLYSLGLFGQAGADATRPTDPDPMPGRKAAEAARVAVVGIPRSLPTIPPPLTD